MMENRLIPPNLNWNPLNLQNRNRTEPDDQEELGITEIPENSNEAIAIGEALEMTER